MRIEWDIQSRILIRAATESDLRPLEWHGGRDLRSFYDEVWEKHEAKELLYLIADFNGYPIGQVLILWCGKPSHPHFPDVQSLRVHPAFRGMGVGSRLIEAAENCARENGCAELGLSVSVENPKAHKLYERCGYVVRGEPYLDEWSYCNAREQTVTLSETVIDLVKPL